MKKTTRLVLFVLFVVALVPAFALAQPNGSLYLADGGAAPVFFNFSVSGQTFVATILTFGPSGNHGQWFAAFGTTDGVNGNGQLIVPAGFSLAEPGGATLQFQLDGANAPGGSFTTKGIELSVKAGRFVRVFP